MYNDSYMIIKGVILLLLGINFFYQLIRMVRSNSKIAFSEKTIHKFECTQCGEEYELNGVETKKKIKGAIYKTVQTFNHQTKQYKFSCPKCQKYSFQEKKFDLNKTRFLGAVRIQMDNNQLNGLIEFAVKGLLPVILGMSLMP